MHSSLPSRPPVAAWPRRSSPGELQALVLLQRGDEAGALEQAVMGAGVEPGVAAARDFAIKPAPPII